MDNATIQKLKDAIAQSANIGVVVGRQPSLDQMAAALSLALTLKEVNKNVTVACPDDPIVEISSLVGIDTVKRNIEGAGGDLVVSFPYLDEGEIEKVSYTIEKGYLNIIVKAGEKGLSFSERDVKYTKGGGGKVDLLFVVGTSKLSDLGEVYDQEKFRDVQIINIDNNEGNQGFGDIVIVSPKLSSVSEQIGDMLLLLGFQIERDCAQNLLSGITHATDNFQSPATSPLAFEIASLVMKQGANRTRAAAERYSLQSQTRYSPTRPQEQRQTQTHGRTRDRSQFEDRDQQRNEQPQRGQDDDQQSDDKAPVDWLEPKVYKGSSNF